MTSQEQIARIVGKVHAWDHRDVLDLRAMIEEARSLGEDIRAHVETLPTEPIDRYLKSEVFPVWSMDTGGLCIAGEQMESVTHVAVLRFLHRNKYPDKHPDTNQEAGELK
jgi:hypothetical protein